MDKAALLGRIDYLLTLEAPRPVGNDAAAGEKISEMYQGALQLVQLIYGPQSLQAGALTTAYSKLQMRNAGTLQVELQPIAVGTLRALRAEVDAGLLGSIALRGAGLALSDILLLAREALGEPGDDAKNIAAVLTAAAFEDTIRRMGETLAGTSGRPKLGDVVDELRKKQVLQGAPLTTAQGYLKFRNDALHADWAQLDRGIVASCLAFVEHLLLKHLS